MTPLAPELTDAQIEHLAHRRARAHVGWLAHAFVFLAVNLLLAGMAFASGRAPRPFGIATLAWALALAVHGAVVLARSHGAPLVERLVARERSRLLAQRDPW